MINIRDENISMEKNLIVYHKGYEQCQPSYGFGPFIRDHYLVHFVKKGQGTFEMQNERYPVEENQAFIIFPDTITHYYASGSNPWSYYWVGFLGDEIEKIFKELGISKASPVIDLRNASYIFTILDSIHSMNDFMLHQNIRSRGLLYLLLEEMRQTVEEHSMDKSNVYLTYVKDYIHRNYSKNIRIKEMSENLNMDRSYLARLFKQEYKCSIQEYLVRYRIERAKYLLITSEISIGSIAYSIGYNDPYHFSKIFKSQVGCSPKIYRENK